jgi:hypothetical protein
MVDLIHEYRQAHPWCAVSTCNRAGEHVHHIRTRGAGGDDNHGNLMALCAEHHGEVHAMGVYSFATKYANLARRIHAAMEAPRG